jgi:hypothetical protein
VAHLPTVIISSLIRTSHQGESHGGVCLVDLDSEGYRQLIDCDEMGIPWGGRNQGFRKFTFPGRAFES